MKLFGHKDKGESHLPEDAVPSEQPVPKTTPKKGGDTATPRTTHQTHQDVEQPLPKTGFRMKRRGSKDSEDNDIDDNPLPPRRASLKSNHSEDSDVSGVPRRAPRKRSLSTDDDANKVPPPKEVAKNHKVDGGNTTSAGTEASVSTNESPRTKGSSHHHHQQRLQSLLQTLSTNSSAASSSCQKVLAWIGVVLLAAAFLALVIAAWILWQQTAEYANNNQDGSTDLDNLRDSATKVLQHVTDTVVQQVNALSQLEQ